MHKYFYSARTREWWNAQWEHAGKQITFPQNTKTICLYIRYSRSFDESDNRTQKEFLHFTIVTKTKESSKKNQKESVLFPTSVPLRILNLFDRDAHIPEKFDLLQIRAGIEPPTLKLHLQCRKQPLCQWGPALKVKRGNRTKLTDVFGYLYHRISVRVFQFERKLLDYGGEPLIFCRV